MGNASYASTTGILRPLRNGIYAASTVNKNREGTAGIYYGIMELSGNLYGRCVSTGIPEGRAFTREHGDAILAVSGNGNVPNWPLTTGQGISYRGGGYVNASDFLRVSDRYDGGNLVLANGGNTRLGFRGAGTVE